MAISNQVEPKLKLSAVREYLVGNLLRRKWANLPAEKTLDVLIFAILNEYDEPYEAIAAYINFRSLSEKTWLYDAGCYCFHTVGINDRVAWTLLPSGICSCLFHKMLQDFIPQPTDPGAAVKTVYR